MPRLPRTCRGGLWASSVMNWDTISSILGPVTLAQSSLMRLAKRHSPLVGVWCSQFLVQFVQFVFLIQYKIQYLFEQTTRILPWKAAFPLCPEFMQFTYISVLLGFLPLIARKIPTG
jgi:hypothetical protein